MTVKPMGTDKRAYAELERLERLSIEELCETADREMEFLLIAIRAIHNRLNNSRIDREQIRQVMREVSLRYSMRIADALSPHPQGESRNLKTPYVDHAPS